MSYSIVRDTRRNRIYFIPPPGVRVPGVHYDGERRWIGRADEPLGGIAAYLDRLSAQIETEAASLAAYQVVLATIPADYGRRHGATLGGEWAIGLGAEDRGSEPSMAGVAPDLDWRKIAQHITHHPEDPRGSIAWTEDHTLILYRADSGWGLVYRENSTSYDDYRTTIWMPPAMYAEYLTREIAQLGITPDSAREWLEKYRGCVGTELYEFAAAVQ